MQEHNLENNDINNKDKQNFDQVFYFLSYKITDGKYNHDSITTKLIEVNLN